MFRAGSTPGDFVTLSNAGNSFGGNSLIFTGAATGYAGVRLGVANALPTNLSVSGVSGTFAGTALDLAGFDQSLNGLVVGQAGTLNIVNLNTGTPSTLTLALTTADQSTANTVILGGGGLGVINVVKDGAFTQTLGGNNTYTGSTTISAGTLVIDEGSIATSSNIVNNAALEYKLTTNARTYANAISGTGSLTKSGTNSLTLGGVNTYSGNTTVSAGTLTLSNAASAANANTGNDASTVTIATTGATLDLTYSGTDKVDKLFIGGVQLAAGIYGPTATSIPQITNSTGSGTLTVLSGPAGFSSWITGTFANGTVPALQQGPNADPDNDGISNLVEYAVADQDPTVGNPTIGTFNGTTLSFTKRAGTSGLTYAIQDSTDLGLSDGWAEVTGGSYVNNATTISYVLTPGTPARNFLRLQVLDN